MFVYPYDTTVCSDHLIANVVKAIKTAEAVEGLVSNLKPKILNPHNESTYNLDDKGIAFVTGYNKEVPPFAHPVWVDFIRGGKLVVDARSFTKVIDKEVVVTSENDANFQIKRALLTLHMMNHSPKDFLSIGGFPSLIYSRWIAENVTKRLGLNPAEQARLVVISSFFYNSLHRETPVYDEMDLHRLIQQISKNTYIPIEICTHVSDNILPMSNVKEFVSQIIHVIDSPRLEKFSSGLLMTILMNSWFGNNSKETVCVGIEHVPTWLSLVYASLNDRMYKNSGIAKVALANDKKDAGKNFIFNINNLIA